MRQTISDALKVDIEECGSAKEIWTRLCEIHDLKTLEYRAEIKREFTNYFLIEGGDMKQHLDGFLQLLLKAFSAGLKYSDEEKSMMFLETLPESFDLIKLQWRLMDPVKNSFVELRRQYTWKGPSVLTRRLARRPRSCLQASSRAVSIESRERRGKQTMRARTRSPARSRASRRSNVSAAVSSDT